MPIAPEVYKKIVTAKVYIDDNFRESLDLDRLSREACLSRYHFHRLFTRIYKVTPHQYLTQKRIGQARRFLASRDLTVTEICNHVGFESIGSFSLLFKKQIGAAPSTYRDEAWRKEQQAIRQPRSELRRSCFATLRLVRNLRFARLSTLFF
ncbi:MAG TPA: AraC family transcriptional regulator [Puia sp.]|nr:AraC family transcriptional regulator [Puia sp.]